MPHLAPRSPVLPLALLVSSCASMGPEQTLAALVSEERAQEQVRELVRLGPRMGGTPSGDEAAELRARAFAAAGLEVRIVHDSPTWAHAETAWSLVLETTDGDCALLDEMTSAWPYGFSPAAEGSAPLSLELAEGAALVTSRLPRIRGDDPLPAIVIVDGFVTSDGLHPKLRHLRPGDGNPFPVFGVSAEDGRFLRESLLSPGAPTTLWYSLEATIAEGRPRTVIASLPAREGAEEGYFLFCAHGDSDAGGPGANDNASGEAIVLEIAAAWAEGVATGIVPPPAREVRFAIWGSEIHSTRDYLSERVPGEGELLGVINYDQAGFGTGSDQLNVEPDDLPGNVGLVHTILEVLEDHAGEPGFPERWATNKSLGGTDSYVFSGSDYFRAGKRPAVTLFASAWDSPEEHERTEGMPGESWSDRDLVYVDYDVYYHSAGDTPENTTDLEPWNMGWCARVGMLAAMRWLERR